MTADRASDAPQAPATHPLPFDPVAFAGALICAPVFVTAVTFFLLVPVAALIMGGPVYLVIGTPILLWMVGRYPPQFGIYAGAGFIANSALVAGLAIESAITARWDNGLLFMALWGLIFAPIWGGTFAVLYRKFNTVKL